MSGHETAAGALDEGWALDYARTYWQRGNEPESQAALTILVRALLAATEPTPDAGEDEGLVAVIAAHRLTTPLQCTCGWRETDTFERWEAHVAAVVAAHYAGREGTHG